VPAPYNRLLQRLAAEAARRRQEPAAYGVEEIIAMGRTADTVTQQIS
jgi:hypothetical protein